MYFYKVILRARIATATAQSIVVP